MNTHDTLDQLAIATLRTLAIDAVEQANSGHPGLPMGAAAMAYCLWTRHLRHAPTQPDWFNRDRFILSAGHGSALLYGLLHLSGYAVTLEDLKQFRQWNSKTPGHPEYGHTPGVEATTGPLGQGVGMAVGMAMAERHLAALYNRPDYEVVQHYTYCLCGDGDLMEGVAAEAASLAGHLQLGRLLVLYDANDISLDGDLAYSFSEDIPRRFSAYGWQVLTVADGNDLAAVDAAIRAGQAETGRPTLIVVKTVIGFGAPGKAGKSAAHGSPLGRLEANGAKAAYQWPYQEAFTVPAAVYEHVRSQAVAKGRAWVEAWQVLLNKYRDTYPELAERLQAALNGSLPAAWEESLPVYETGAAIATRSASFDCLQALAAAIPDFLGGSADLASSNKTFLKGSTRFAPPDYQGRNIWFGVREFGMGAALNGMALHGGLRVFGATFFVFADYLRPAIRLAALMQLPVTYVFTHDSIAVGEDGPTHQPVEQLASLRAMPNLIVLRPADANETSAAWRLALRSRKTPTALVLSRQDLPVLPGSREQAATGVSQGAYLLSPAAQTPELLLLASGSEVALALAVQQQLTAEGVAVSVVSMPSWELFEQQPESYRASVLPPQIKRRLAIEMGAGLGWERYVGSAGRIWSIERFGASAPSDTLLRAYGFSVEAICAAARELLTSEPG